MYKSSFCMMGFEYMLFLDFHIQTDKEAETDQKKQSDYEAEVVMYRALEQLDASIIVLHGLKYTHKQFRMWDSNHDAKSCSKETNKSPSCKNKELNKTEGEHDFVVIGPDYIVKIEVKNPKVFQPSAASNIMPKSPIRSSINNAKVQLKKAEELICGIAEKTSGQSFQKIELIQLVAFPNLDQTEISQGTDNSEVNLVLVNKSDLQNFKTFWKNNIEGQKKSKTSIDGDIGKIQSVLIQMFAIGTNNKIEEIEISPAIRKLKNKISLADCVVDIDRKLRDGRITFERENRSSKPNVSKISDTSDTKLDKLPAFLKTSNPADTALTDNDKKIFKDYLGLNYVTNEQWKAYQNQSRYQIITGPTGSGKTLILLAKIFHLALTDSDSKIKFRVANHVDLVEYKSLFEKARIKVAEVQENHPFNREELKNNQILIIHQPNFDLSDDFDFEFIDDYQINLCQNTDQEISGKRKGFVLTVDLNQKPMGTKTATPKDISQNYGLFDSAKPDQLSACYRSTRNIVSQLITLSEHIHNHAQKTENQSEIANQTKEQENQTSQIGNQTKEKENSTEQKKNLPEQSNKLPEDKKNLLDEKENQEEDQEKLADKKEDGNDKLQHEAKQKEIETKKLDSQTRETEKLSHIPLYGHFIHGPQILVQVYRQDAIEYFHWDTIEKIFNLEIKDREIECAFFFFPRFFHRRGKREEWIRDNSDDLFTAGTEKRKEFISSSEFTQCHILLPFDPTTDYAEALQFLYNAISRARVLCHVHVLMNKSRDEVDGKLRVIFPEARIKYEEPEP